MMICLGKQTTNKMDKKTTNKAKEISKNCSVMPPTAITHSDVLAMTENAAMQMAEWKDEQFKSEKQEEKKPTEWLDNPNRQSFTVDGDTPHQCGSEPLATIISTGSLLSWLKDKQAELTKQLKEKDDPVHWGQRNAFTQVIEYLAQPPKQSTVFDKNKLIPKKK